jgi:hypothetical protein
VTSRRHRISGHKPSSELLATITKIVIEIVQQLLDRSGGGRIL